MNPAQSQQEIARELFDKATELYGAQRAEAIRATLEEAAEHLWVISHNLPDKEEEPAFFL
ncbi:MAG: hypothetical protein J4F43_00540 [Dehalococcoidia bacterium]|nr:hypothetical protein [Dehalococcoidia bacterium]